MSDFNTTTHQSENVKHKMPSRFEIPERLAKLIKRSQELAISGKRQLYTADETQLLYHWTDKCNAIVPQSGDWSYAPEENMSLGDHGCRVDTGMDFPLLDEVPSHKNGYEETPENWALDYAFLLDNTPAEIHPYEAITGEFHWEMNEIRQYEFGPEVHEAGRIARELGAGGTSHGHTCLDFSIGLESGWGGILKNIEKHLALYERLGQKNRAGYLRGLKTVCEAIIRYIKKYSDRAKELAENEKDPEQKKLYEKISVACNNISENPPSTFYETVQWIQFGVMTDRMVGHGNGYGKLDKYLLKTYESDIAKGNITREEARVYVAEMFLKLRGQFFCLGGRKADGSDFTNVTSWIVMEAYDMIDDYNNLGVMWHPDMDKNFYKYVCDVLARHGAGIPSLVNYDLIRDAELRSGIAEEYAAEVSYAGCQWFCIPGREYCDQDVNALVFTDPFFRALETAVNENCDDFEKLYSLLFKEFRRTCEALRIFKDIQYEKLPKVWPEMASSLNCHGPADRGLDITDARGVDVQNTSTNILGVPNVVDSMHAIKKQVFEKHNYTLKEVQDAVRSNWKDKEAMRLEFLNEDKYGNDKDEVDNLMVRIADDIADIMDNMRNNRGQEYRGSMFQFMGHTCTDLLPATPDGRKAGEPLAHGCNPTAGMSHDGLIAAAKSVSKIPAYKYQGGSLQVELQPNFFDGKPADSLWEYVQNFSLAFFRDGGTQINLNIMDLEALRDAIEHPENPEYQNIIIKVTGYTARFVSLCRNFQEEFVGRTNYGGIK